MHKILYVNSSQLQRASWLWWEMRIVIPISAWGLMLLQNRAFIFIPKSTVPVQVQPSMFTLNLHQNPQANCCPKRCMGSTVHCRQWSVIALCSFVCWVTAGFFHCNSPALRDLVNHSGEGEYQACSLANLAITVIFIAEKEKMRQQRITVDQQDSENAATSHIASD